MQSRSRAVGAAAAFHDDYDEYDPTIEDSYMGEDMLCLASYEFQKASTKMKKRGRGRRSSFSPPPSPPALDVEVAQVIGLFHCRWHSCMYQQLSLYFNVRVCVCDGSGMFVWRE